MSTAAFPCSDLPSSPATAGAAENARCECCGSGDHHRVSRKRGYALRRCRDCGVVFVSPQPTTQQLDALYRKESGYFATAQTDLSSVPAASALWLENALLDGGAVKGRFLDVGCANGSLMHAMRGLG